MSYPKEHREGVIRVTSHRVRAIMFSTHGATMKRTILPACQAAKDEMKLFISLHNKDDAIHNDGQRLIDKNDTRFRHLKMVTERRFVEIAKEVVAEMQQATPASVPRRTSAQAATA